MRRLFALSVVAVLLVSCGIPNDNATGDDGSSPQEQPRDPDGKPDSTGHDSAHPDENTEAPVRVPEPADRITGEVPDSILQEVLSKAAELTGVPMADLQVVRSEATIWSDGSLGCPEPGMNYTQAIEPGYRVEVSAGDTELDFRISESGFIKLCESPMFDSPTP